MPAPSRKRKKKDPQRGPAKVARRPKVAAEESGRGLVLLHTGDGKGKTSAALGIVLRGWGHGMRVAGFQFIKSKDRKYGEHRAVAKMENVTLEPLGDGFTWLSENMERDKAYARVCWERCAKALRDPTIEILLLDEITYPISYGWLDEKEIVRAIRARPARMHVLLTGRDATEGLIELADTATEMKKIKHAYDVGIPARKGIEL